MMLSAGFPTVMHHALQDDGYAGTLKSKRKGNDAGELGRTGNAFVPMQVRWGRVGGRVCSFHPASCLARRCKL